MKDGKNKTLTTAPVLTAVLASLCCIGPLVAVGLGLGAFGASAFFDSLRPYFLGLTALLLALAFYLAYRKDPGEKCANDRCAVSPGKRRQRILLWIVTVVVLLLAAFPYYSGWIWGSQNQVRAATIASTSEPAAVATVVLDIKGMTCAGCVVKVTSALTGVPGVVSATVSLKTNSAKVRYDPSRVKVEELVAAVVEAGYQATPRGHETPPEGTSSLPGHQR